MKTLLIIRHAKSSWNNALLNDFDRPLNERGRNDAPMMAKKLRDRKLPVNAFVSSPAERAFATAAYFAEAFGVKKKDIIRIPELYHATVPVFYTTVSRIADDIATAALFSHNPGITAFVNELTGTRIDNMPTCGIFAVKAPISQWKDFAGAEKQFLFFDYPKL
ncbi:MAG: histidine phosphatase family protein [Sediminibacterium sp.]